MTFRKREAERVFKSRQMLFSPAACQSLSSDKEHLGAAYCTENLFEGFRESSLDFFEKRKIKWHDMPVDTSIVSSQISCVNCLFQFIDRPLQLASWLREIYKDLDEVLPIVSNFEPALKDNERPQLSFEWIGERNYLSERGWGKRGANCTNGDVALRFR
jgi:hypothetical protein